MSLSLENVTLGYGGPAVVRDLTLAVPEGEFTAVIGPNGCGKSTVLKALARTLRPTSGRVELDGHELRSLRPKAVARRVAALPQHPIAPESLRVRDLVARGRHPYHSLLRQWLPGDAGIVSDAMTATGVTAYADRLLTDLSGGQRQRVWIAMVLAQQTQYVLLDEPRRSSTWLIRSNCCTCARTCAPTAAQCWPCCTTSTRPRATPHIWW